MNLRTMMALTGLFVSVVAAVRPADNDAAAESERMHRRIQMIQNLYPPDWPFLGHCLDPEVPNGLLNFDLRECEESETSAFELDSRIAIVGAGPAGVSMAKLLGDRGFEDVTIFEKEDRVGGKSKNIELESGELLDVGTVWTANKYECVELWADQVGMAEAPVNPDGETLRLISSTQSVLANMTPPNFATFPVWLADYAFRNYGIDPAAYAEQLFVDAQNYIANWTQSMGSFEYMFPNEATVDFAAINQSFLSWLEERELFALIPRLIVSTSAQGYGSLESIPAFYGLTFNHPNFFGGSGTQAGIIGDWQTMWERILNTTDATVHLETNISRIRRYRNFVEIDYRNKEDSKMQRETFDFVIMAAPMPGALDLLWKPTPEELSLFSKYNYKNIRYDVGNLNNTGVVPEDTFNLFSWMERADQQTDFHVTTRSDGQAGTLERYSLVRDGIDGAVTLARFGRIKNVSDSAAIFSISPFDSSVEEVRELLQEDLDSYGMEMEFTHTEIWNDYFPWKNLTQVVEDRVPWRIWENQGKERTWFIGSYASFESVADVLDYNLKLVNERLCVPKDE